MSTLEEELGEEVRVALGSLHWRVRHYEVGRVVGVGDGVGRVKGVASVRYDELLERSDGLMGLAFDLRPREVGVLFLDRSEHVSAGDELAPPGGWRASPSAMSCSAGWSTRWGVRSTEAFRCDRRPDGLSRSGRRASRTAHRSASRCTPASR